jgi:hypothetical protein
MLIRLQEQRDRFAEPGRGRRRRRRRRTVKQPQSASRQVGHYSLNPIPIGAIEVREDGYHRWESRSFTNAMNVSPNPTIRHLYQTIESIRPRQRSTP